MDLNKFKIAGIFLLVIALTGVLTACEMNGNGNGEAEVGSLSGRLVTEVDGEILDSSGLLVLEKDGAEIDRQYNERDEEKFRFENLSAREEYTLSVYNIGADEYSTSVMLEEGDNDIGEIDTDIERPEAEEKDGVFILDINTEYSPMEEENARQALAYAIDKLKLANTAENFLDSPEDNSRYITQRANRIIPPAAVGNDGSQELNLEQDIEKAESLLDQEIDIIIHYNEESPFYEELIGEIGSDVEEVDNLNVTFEAEVFDTPEYEEAPAVLKAWNFSMSPNVYYEGFIDMDEEAEDLLYDVRMNLDDPDVALQYLDEFEEKVIEEGRIIPIFHRASYQE